MGVSLYSMIVPVGDLCAQRGRNAFNADPAMIVTFGAGLLAELAGTIVLGISSIRGRSGSRWIGYLLVASARLR